jgi:hypothetical protein
VVFRLGQITDLLRVSQIHWDIRVQGVKLFRQKKPLRQEGPQELTLHARGPIGERPSTEGTLRVPPARFLIIVDYLQVYQLPAMIVIWPTIRSNVSLLRFTSEALLLLHQTSHG